jgi:hypothetical protein
VIAKEIPMPSAELLDWVRRYVRFTPQDFTTAEVLMRDHIPDRLCVSPEVTGLALVMCGIPTFIPLRVSSITELAKVGVYRAQYRPQQVSVASDSGMRPAAEMVGAV